jgi:hypothetical protein
MAWKKVRRAPGTKWADLLREHANNMNLRVASRHMTVARAPWATEFENSELREMLPADLIKLEILAKLQESQIVDLYFENDVDLRLIERTELARKVKELLPKSPPKRNPEPGRRLLTLARGLKSKSTGIIAEWEKLGVDEQERDTVLDELKAVVNTLEHIETQESEPFPQESVKSVDPAGNDLFSGVA